MRKLRKSARSAENSGNPIKNGGKNQGFGGMRKPSGLAQRRKKILVRKKTIGC